MTTRVRRRKLRRGAGAPSGARTASPGPGGAAAQGSAPLPAGRLDIAALAAAVLGPLALYAATLPRTVVLEDDGLFLMAGVHLGVAHPPGYPIYTLIVHLFTRLPFGDAAVLGHLSSAVLGALACGAVYCCARLLRASRAPALTAAWLLGVSEQFWSQAIITEVYTLNALLFFGGYALVLLGARDPRRPWPLWCAAVAWGAGLANHWPLMVLATPGLALALLPAWREVLPRLPRLLGAAFVTAALPYAWMVWLSQQAPAISFYGPIDTWSDLWFYVSRQGYSEVDASPSAGWSDRAAFLGWFAADLVRQTTLPGFALAGLGLGALARGGGLVATALAGSGLVALLGNSVALIVLLGFDFDPFRLAVFRPYPLICYGVAALWAAAGMQWLMDHLPGRTAKRWPARVPGTARVSWATWVAASAAALLGAAMVAVSASASWPANDRSASDFAERARRGGVRPAAAGRGAVRARRRYRPPRLLPLRREAPVRRGPLQPAGPRVRQPPVRSPLGAGRASEGPGQVRRLHPGGRCTCYPTTTSFPRTGATGIAVSCWRCAGRAPRAPSIWPATPAESATSSS